MSAPVRVVCQLCGSDDVTRDAVARWCVEAQDWVLSGVHDDMQCQSCEYEGHSFKEERVDGRKIEIDRMLTLSTGHLRASTLLLMEGNDIDGIVLWPKADYGYFVWVPDGGSTAIRLGAVPFQYPDAVPNELRLCLEFAREHGCAYVCFDCDGDTVEGLVTYEH